MVIVKPLFWYVSVLLIRYHSGLLGLVFLLARQEAEAEGKTEMVEMFTDVHILQTMSDIFFGKFNK